MICCLRNLQWAWEFFQQFYVEQCFGTYLAFFYSRTIPWMVGYWKLFSSMSKIAYLYINQMTDVWNGYTETIIYRRISHRTHHQNHGNVENDESWVPVINRITSPQLSLFACLSNNFSSDSFNLYNFLKLLACLTLVWRVPLVWTFNCSSCSSCLSKCTRIWDTLPNFYDTRFHFPCLHTHYIW